MSLVAKLQATLIKENPTRPYDQIRDGRNRRIHRGDRALLAGWIYQRPHGNAISLWDLCHQLYWVVLNRIHYHSPRREDSLEPELEVFDSCGIYRGIYDVFDF